MLPLLRTKTTVPQTRLRQIERAQLLKRIDAGMEGALTLIVAPAGFGKTTLAAAWAEKAGIPAAWLSLQPADQAPGRFLIYLVQALQTISPALGQTTAALLQSGSQEGGLYALLNDLAEFQGDFAIILDDYHSADCPNTAQIIQFLLENRPANLHLMITSRAAPSLSLTRLRAQGQLTEISTADLRFSRTEISNFLEKSMDLQLAPAEIDRLNQLTEGWAVGLQLAGLAWPRHTGDWTIPAGQALIFDYLAEEVLRHEPPDVQDFLKKTAILDRFCTPLCEELLSLERDPAESPAGSQAKAILAYIERANLFLVPLDAAGTWFRYHALFTDFLRRHTPTDKTSALYQAASRWFEKNGMLEDAVHYAIHAADYERAASILQGSYIDIIQRGEQSALLEWISAMPPALLEKHPRLWLAKGWVSVISFNAVEAVSCAEKAESLMPLSAADDVRGEAKALRVLAGIFAGQAAAVEEISEAFVLLSEQDDFLHCLLHFNLGLNFVMQGQTAQAVEAFTETLRLTATQKIPLVAIVAQTQMAETRQIRGALGLAERAVQQAVRYAKETLGEHTFLLGMPYISYADLLREQNRFDQAVWYGEQGISYCQRWQPVASMDGQIALARLLAAQGDWEAAFSRLEQAMQVAEESNSVLDDTFVAIHLVRLALLQGDLPKADRYINAYELEKIGESSYYHLRELTRLVLLRARVSRLADDPSAAPAIIETLSSLIAEAEWRERITPVIEGLILRAYALSAYAQHTYAQYSTASKAKIAAADSLTRALTLAAQSGYIRIIADEGQQLLRLLEQYRDQIHAPRSYVDQIVQILRCVNAQLASPQTREPALFSPPETQIPLTRRELDILERLAAGKSNQEIAAECTLALTTVKKHVANILSKLEVSNRTQAAAVARKQGWI
jgi:LuxR family transcriptional regulator, maltose regulon positive regulatory protein